MAANEFSSAGGQTGDGVPSVQSQPIDYEALTEDQHEILDDLVHDTASQIASDTNNAGPKAQVEFLLSNGFTLEGIQEYFRG